jgi:hypothetical protein
MVQPSLPNPWRFIAYMRTIKGLKSLALTWNFLNLPIQSAFSEYHPNETAEVSCLLMLVWTLYRC